MDPRRGADGAAPPHPPASGACSSTPSRSAPEYGHRLLANFRDLPASPGAPVVRLPRRPPRSAPQRPSRRPQHPYRSQGPSRALAADRPRAGPGGGGVLVRSLPTEWHDEAVFEALFGGLRARLLARQQPVHEGAGRFSVMGDAAGPLAARGDRRRTARHGDRDRAAGGRAAAERALPRLARRRPGRCARRGPGAAAEFALGWVGYLGYELKAECGGDATRTAPTDPGRGDGLRRPGARVRPRRPATTYLLALAADGDRDPARRPGWRTTAARLRAARRPPPPARSAPPVRARAGAAAARPRRATWR